MEKDELEEGETYLLLKTILHPEAVSQGEFVLSHPERQRHLQPAHAGGENVYRSAHTLYSHDAG